MQSPLSRYRGRTTVVTGARGYIGAALLAALRRAEARVLAVSRVPMPSSGVIAWQIGDPRSAGLWAAVLPRADVIFHLAGNTSVYDAERDPDSSFAATVTPIDLMAAAAQLAGRAPRVVFASTATVYGLTTHLPVDETTAPDPITTYDRHKCEAEQRLLAAWPHLDGTILRMSNVYGPSAARSAASERGFLNRSIERAIQGHDIEVYGDGRYLRDFVHLDDVVEALLAAGVEPVTGERCFNIASGVGVTIRDAVGMAIAHAARVSGRAVAMHENTWPAHAHAIERRNFVANIDRVRAALRWRPTVLLAGGIGRFADQAAASGCAP
jgi:nucleoside-diphosphate-sugar epimerase